MAEKTKPRVSPTIKTKAKEVLAFAQDKSRECKEPGELFLVIFGPRGKVNVTFPSERERAAFERTDEIKEIEKLIQPLWTPPVTNIDDPFATGDPIIRLRVPKSVHDALVAEAAEQGVSLDQLCFAKLAAQLRMVLSETDKKSAPS